MKYKFNGKVGFLSTGSPSLVVRSHNREGVAYCHLLGHVKCMVWCGGQPEECLVCFSGIRGLGLLSASGLVDPASPDVPDPFYHVVVAVVQLWLKHFQITHLQPRRSKWNLKVHRNGWSSPFLFIISG